MSLSSIDWAYGQDLPAEEKFVLVVLADEGGADNTRRPSLAHLAKKCGLHVERVFEILKALDELHLIVVRRWPVNTQDVLELSLAEEAKVSPRVPEAGRSRLAHVYIIEADHGACKVGISSNLVQRSRTVGHAVGVPTRLAWSVDCSIQAARQIEQAILSAFRARRLAGEWVQAPVHEVIAAAERFAAQYKAEAGGNNGAH